MVLYIEINYKHNFIHKRISFLLKLRINRTHRYHSEYCYCYYDQICLSIVFYKKIYIFYLLHDDRHKQPRYRNNKKSIRRIITKNFNKKPISITISNIFQLRMVVRNMDKHYRLIRVHEPIIHLRWLRLKHRKISLWAYGTMQNIEQLHSYILLGAVLWEGRSTIDDTICHISWEFYRNFYIGGVEWF